MYGADTMDGVLMYFSWLTGVNIRNAHLPTRQAFDANGVDIGYQQSGLFNSHNNWEVNANGKIYSFHYFSVPCRYLYLHRSQKRENGRDLLQPETLLTRSCDDPAAVMRLATTATPSELRGALNDWSRVYRKRSKDGSSTIDDVPTPLIRLALEMPEAISATAGPEWWHDSLEAGSHRWLRAPQRQCGLMLHPEKSAYGWGLKPPVFMWLIGYFDRERAERIVRAATEHHANANWQQSGCVIIWKEDVAEAASAAFEMLKSRLLSVPPQSDVIALRLYSDLMAELCIALESGIEQHLPPPNSVANDELAEDIDWLRVVTRRAPTQSTW